jgi:Family of unknown function (DUF5681)
MGRKPISNRNNGGHETRPATSETSTDPDAPGQSLGYGRPPLHSRFKPGQSGYPKGRAKQSRNMRTIVRQVLNEKMQIRENGRMRRVSALEALIRLTLARCLKGDAKAVASLIAIMRQSGYGPDRDEASADLLEIVDSKAILADYHARNFASDKTDTEIESSPESSIPNSSKKVP